MSPPAQSFLSVIYNTLRMVLKYRLDVIASWKSFRELLIEAEPVESGQSPEPGSEGHPGFQSIHLLVSYFTISEPL